MLHCINMTESYPVKPRSTEHVLCYFGCIELQVVMALGRQREVERNQARRAESYSPGLHRTPTVVPNLLEPPAVLKQEPRNQRGAREARNVKELRFSEPKWSWRQWAAFWKNGDLSAEGRLVKLCVSE